jgi:polysaccharide export outer membrane protein
MNPGRHLKLILVFLLLWSFAASGLAPAGVLGQSKKDAKRIAADTRPLNQPDAAVEPADEAAIQNQINSVYDSFYHSYRLGPGDVIAVHVDKHPEDSAERIVVSPVGQVYYSLLGNVTVVGKTMPQLQEYFTTSISEFIREPRVTVSMLEANSSKIGVLGDVRTPGVILMTRPMKVLDAITAAGGITDLGSSSDVSILRQYEDGRVQVVSVNVKNILKGKAGLEDNVYLRSGDTIIVHGNLFKKLGVVSSMLGIASFATFMGRGGR